MLRHPTLLVLSPEAASPERAEALLTAAERAEYAAFRFPKRRHDWLLGRLAAKLALAESGGPDPGAITIRKLEGGRPAFDLDAPGWDLSITHGHGLAAALVAPAPVGIDLEAVRPLEADAWRFFTSEDEQARLAAGELSPIALWAIKEAGYKALHGAVPGLRHVTWQPPGRLAHAGGSLRVRHVTSEAWCLAIATPDPVGSWFDALSLKI